MEVTKVKQADLTSECWLIQFRGLSACRECEFLNTAECGGKKIRKTLVNSKGIRINKNGLISNQREV